MKKEFVTLLLLVLVEIFSLEYSKIKMHIKLELTMIRECCVLGKLIKISVNMLAIVVNSNL